MSTAMLRRYLAEFIGTFLLVFMGTTARAIVGDTADPAGIIMVHVTFGFTIVAMIYTVGYISGAHFNPALTFGFALSRHFPWRYVVPYWVSQILGATCASLLELMLLSSRAAAVHFGGTKPVDGTTTLQALGAEIVLTFLLMFVNMGVATDRRTNRVIVGITIGFTVIIGGLAGNSLSGGSINPARSLGPAFFGGPTVLSQVWIYIVGPIIGAVIGAMLFKVLRGTERYIKGVPEELNPRQPESEEQVWEEEVKEATSDVKP